MRLYYTKCNHTPMNKFISALVNDDLSSILVVWLPLFFFRKKLQLAWDDLYAEYSSLIGGEQSNVSFSLIKDVTFIRNKLYILETCVNSMYIRYNVRIAGLLRSQGFSFKYREDTYKQDCERVVKRAKSLVADLLKKEGELKKMGDGAKLNEQDYIDMVYAIGRRLPHRLSINEITVSEFCSAYNSYNKEVEYEKSQAKNKR